MSFTQDELQAFNTILEQKLSEQRRALERSFEQRLLFLQQECTRSLERTFVQLQNGLKDALMHKLDVQQARISQMLLQELVQRQQQQHYALELLIKRTLAERLISLEQMLNAQTTGVSEQAPSENKNGHQDFEGIEVQTDIAWEDLVESISKALDERLAISNEALRSSLRAMERDLLARLHSLREELVRAQSPHPSSSSKQPQVYTGSITSLQDVFTSIEQLERLIESMQVAMTSNHALLSNRLYHHQQLPLERAHARSDDHTMPEQKSR